MSFCNVEDILIFFNPCLDPVRKIFTSKQAYGFAGYSISFKRAIFLWSWGIFTQKFFIQKKNQMCLSLLKVFLCFLRKTSMRPYIWKKHSIWVDVLKFFQKLVGIFIINFHTSLSFVVLGEEHCDKVGGDSQFMVAHPSNLVMGG